MPHPDQEDRRMFNVLTMFALLIRCPTGEAGKNGNCPFVEFRNGCDLEEKFRLAESLPAEKCLEMLGFHDSCLADTFRNSLKICQYGPADKRVPTARKMSATASP